ncbi:protein translocase subunit SecF [Aggregatibacter actinomycetemcomitans]|uniref:protein translocase subunit SecF n=1 Tax=Aggregatibacter actinomycetemcomitans TaxID=714 RepID=UPI000517E2CD|nr:protein translocase subunit SecF [Aggregatibacter actinomycetemcomitans]KNE76646.1 preprotein translocase subunit SecF [Aggregatibacter actinomycetemcomitans RhAA1]MBN6063965.1 protein translocase subunit SecF [Aggregatibacter actinomycetemcomitans]MBN6075205.1 protein translocase subunit SecF [Aggregatibacter actinomycetemcomitans]MBN6081620.1 protein translocase subunit SecF [Aggregatibacter actinomycetemcomitans]MBN6083866.1 protein translocase subunit SecF [Aggregatibacter actinomycetem
MNLENRSQSIREIQGIKLPFRLVEFMKYRMWGYLASVIIIAVSLFFVFTKGFNWGLDFTGGVVVDTHFSQPADLEKIRSTLVQNGIESPLVQTTGGVRDVMIRLPATDNAQIGDNVKRMLSTLDSDIQIRSTEFVGPNVGEELTQGAIYATLTTLIMLLLYVGMRFEWRLAVGGVLSLTHDVIVTLGAFSYLQIEMDLTFIAAILSVVGYSLNDSIVVFDRVRENFRKIRRIASIDIINISLTQTLSRTIMTSVTTLIVVIALFVFGGPTIHSFSLALLIGIGFGTYSSIFVAIAIAYDLGLDREHMVQPKVNKDDIDELP